MSRTGEAAWIQGAGIGLAFLLLVYAGVALQPKPRGESGHPQCTTYSSDEGGYLALYRWLRAQGVAAERWERELLNLPPEARVLLVAEPSSAPGRSEIPALWDWIRGGGTLVLAADPRGPFMRAIGLEPRAGESGDRRGIRPTAPGPYSRGVRTLLPGRARGLRTSRPEVVIHLAGPQGGIVAVMAAGKGRVIALTAPEIFTNGELRKGDHARLALNILLEHLGDGVLLVDEYHHGYGRVSSVFEYLGRSFAVAPLAQGALAALLLVVVLGRRFGPPRLIQEERRRSSMEYVRAMGDLLHRARASGLALESMASWVEEEACRMQLEGDRPLQSALRKAKDRAREPRMSDRDLLGTARGLYGALEISRKRTPRGGMKTDAQ
jgi:hypothetical protein